MTQMPNLARGHALSQGRTFITMEDIPIVIHTVLSSATIERVRLFELLITHKGVLTTSIICDSLSTSPPTARKTMTELRATKLVDDITDKEPYNSEMKHTHKVLHKLVMTHSKSLSKTRIIRVD